MDRPGESWCSLGVGYSGSGGNMVDAIYCLALARQLPPQRWADMSIPGCGGYIRPLFWRILPILVPDLAAHLPALADTVRPGVRFRTDLMELKHLAYHPLPQTLPPGTMHWFDGLVDAWQERKEKSWKQLYNGTIGVEYRYFHCLTALARLDGCGMPPGAVRPSLLPLLFRELRRVYRVKRGWAWKEMCVFAMSHWRPAAGVVTAPKILEQWVSFWCDFWLDMSRENMIVGRGIAAKALLNLIEAGVSIDVSPVPNVDVLLGHLAEAIQVATDGLSTSEWETCRYYLHNLQWQPTDPTRFPEDALDTVTQAWSAAAVSSEPVVTAFRDQFDLIRFSRGQRPNFPARLLRLLQSKSVRIYRMWNLVEWLPRPGEIAPETQDEIKELMEMCKGYGLRNRQSLTSAIAWWAQFHIRRAVPDIEPADCFDKRLLKAVTGGKTPGFLFLLSHIPLSPDVPDNIRQKYREVWERRLTLKSESKRYTCIRQAAVSALILSHPDDDVATRWERLQWGLRRLPNHLLPKVSAQEINDILAINAPPLPAGIAPVTTANGSPFRARQLLPVTT